MSELSQLNSRYVNTMIKNEMDQVTFDGAVKWSDIFEEEIDASKLRHIWKKITGREMSLL